ncbi:YkgJ family cysteine cluster protein [Desulfovibrio sulfodismutans]|uniref:YkgJ family cysteine cluster protein n=1 Tax=Desulfolutivibrio sulfodismutans TaxID=63561 RepID=A0A7K3NHU6_9BACT|nr:YkgJ family cysteine cluster protein [Desulfolutivibrio sulfodismutans]NDY55355.1 YkgJ family cysteine cluster protein [Desulfolutivibrio sulfodismutans]QLA11056.1 YkgJ family cysteine cluster protein [Desulfolutivibrio sulfodismutans DSM 3696]
MSENSAFTCRLCGHCCQGEGGIVLAEADIVRLCDHLRLSREELLARAVTTVCGKHRIKSRPDGYCLFFQEGTGCGVHPARPDICRAWPFFRGNLIDAISWEMAQDFCPGIAPDVPHAEFARQGLAYLREQGICRCSGPCDPAAAGSEGKCADKRREADTPEALVMNDTDADAMAKPAGTAPHAA